MRNGIVLSSGGIDSITTAYYVKKRLKYKNLIILFFNYGQKSLEMERKFSKKCAKYLKGKFIEIRLEWLGKISNSLINKKGKAKKLKKSDLKNTKKESEKYYVPCRNIVFITHALALADSIFVKDKTSSDIFLGFKCEGDESYPDTTQQFVKQMDRLSKISTSGRFNIKTPLIKKDKEDIIKLGTRLGVDFRNTFSCYIGKRKHCGYCLSCKLRQAGFYWANIKDPTEYSSIN